MTNQQHPITPPLDLVEQWANMFEQHTDAEVFNQAARWGADQELEACCEWMQAGFGDIGDFPDKLRAARRPKPPSLKEQALNDLDLIQTHDSFGFQIIDLSTIRRALEQLDD